LGAPSANLIHAELALLCDVVLAADTAEVQDLPHFTSRPGCE
jgi:hypothetical protein